MTFHKRSYGYFPSYRQGALRNKRESGETLIK